MPDKVKVFLNATATQPSGTLAAVPVNVVVNNSTTQAVVRDLSFNISHPTPEYAGLYKYPFKVKLGNYTVASGSGSATYTGSQIVDINQTLSVEIQAEAQAVDYGVLELAGYLNGNFYYTRVPLNSIGAVPTTANLLSAIDPRNININRTQNQWGSVPGSSYTGVIISRAGATQIVSARGSQFTVYNTIGTEVANVNLPDTCYAMAADATYLYFKANSSDQNIYRYTISTLAQAGTLVTNATIPGVSSVNWGSIDHYNGTLYIQPNGSSGTTYRINTTTGATDSINIPSDGNGECMGGRITVNRAGVPFFVRQDDTRIVVYNINTTATTTLTSPWPTDPTTTQGRNIFVLSNGIVMFNNASYGTASVVDVNTATPTVIRTDAILPLGGNTTTLMASTNFQTAPVNVTRNIIYDMHASGIEIT